MGLCDRARISVSDARLLLAGRGNSVGERSRRVARAEQPGHAAGSGICGYNSSAATRAVPALRITTACWTGSSLEEVLLELADRHQRLQRLPCLVGQAADARPVCRKV